MEETRKEIDILIGEGYIEESKSVKEYYKFTDK